MKRQILISNIFYLKKGLSERQIVIGNVLWQQTFCEETFSKETFCKETFSKETFCKETFYNKKVL